MSSLFDLNMSELLVAALWCALAALAAFVIHRGYPLNAIVLYAMGATCVQYVLRGGAPLFPRWTLSLELVQSVVRTVADKYGDRVSRPHYYLKLRRLSALYGDFIGKFACRTYGTEVVPVTVNGLEHVWLKACVKTTTSANAAEIPRPKSPSAAATVGVQPTKRFVVLYYHGGGYVVLSPRMYIDFANNLRAAIVKDLECNFQVEKPRVDVFLANYRKAPECKFPIPAQDAVAMYKYLVNDEGLSPRQIILAGDSAGGGLVLSTLLRLRQSQPGLLPLAGILHCPKTTMAPLQTEPTESSAPYCFLSPSLFEAFRTSYLKTPNDPSTWQDASAVHCDLRDLPPVFLQTAKLDSIYQESLAIAAKVKADGITNWELDEHEQMPHVFATLPSFILPYGQVGIAAMAKFAAKQFNATLGSNNKYLKHKRASRVPAA